MLCTCATTRAAMVVSKSKDSAPFSRPTVPHSQQYHLIVGPLGPFQSYASWAQSRVTPVGQVQRPLASSMAFGVSFDVLNSYQPARNSLWRQPTAAVLSWDHNFLLFFCGSRADPSCQDVTVTRSLSGRRLCTARSPEKQLFRLVDGAIYLV